MKVVLDTNVWLSGIFWEGEASRIIEAAEDKKVEVIITKEILTEIISVLNKEEKFQKFIVDKNQDIKDLTRTILYISSMVEAKTKVNFIKDDPADNIILEAALEGKAELILSYDKHLLNLIEFKGIKVLTPTEFLKNKSL